jgi:hypothetical protein
MTSRVASFLQYALAATAALGISGLGLQAQTQTPAPKDVAMAPQLLMVQLVTVKPESVPQYVALQKGDVIPAQQKGGVKVREVWQAAVFGPSNEYANVTMVDDMAQFDGPNPMTRALGAEGYQAYLARVRPLITGTRTFLIQTRPDLSFGATNPSKLAIRTHVQVLPTRQLEFETFLKNEFIPVLKKAQVKRYTVARVILGGSTTEYITVLTLDSFADLAKGHPINRLLGEDAANKLMARAGAFISSAERYVMRLNEDLSFQVTPTSQAR